MPVSWMSATYNCLVPTVVSWLFGIYENKESRYGAKSIQIPYWLFGIYEHEELRYGAKSIQML